MSRSTVATCVVAFATLTALLPPAMAEEWSDTSIGWRYGTQFKEPYVANGAAISKNIIDFQHVGGYAYGTNFFNIDLLMSDSTDSNAQEAYVVYRNTIDFSKVTGKKLSFGPVSSLGLTFGFDWNSKNDPGYASKKRLLVIGPTVMFDVPGFLTASVLILNESNRPVGIESRYTYKTHPMLGLSWGIPFGTTGLAFEGYFNWIAAKGTNEFGGPTAAETNFDGELMYDIASLMHLPKNTLRVGFEYQYWRNKFGNPSNVPGSLAKTPMVRVEYHF